MRAAVVVLALVGCGQPAPDGSGTTTGAPSSLAAWQDTQPIHGTTSGGLIDVEVEVGPEHDAFQISASSANKFVGLIQMTDPSGAVVVTWEDWWYSAEYLSDAFFGWSRTMAFDWPSRIQDGTLTPGTWTLQLYTSDAQGNYVDADIDGTVFLKDDADLQGGQVPVHIVYANNQDKTRVTDAVEAAVERWREIWASQGMELVEDYTSSSIDKDFTFAYQAAGSDEVAALVATLPAGELVIVIGETIDGDVDTYGLAAGVPGSLEATPVTWTLISWLVHAGPDGEFDDEEIRILGETMAHEVGHYTGLYHPVECWYDCGEEWDALPDTPACTGWQECEDLLGSNLMFPYPVCTFSECTPAGDITTDQAGVSNRYAGVH